MIMNMQTTISLSVLTLTLIVPVWMWPFGALPDSCGSMTAPHGTQPEEPNPYRLDVTREGNDTNSSIAVTIAGEPFQGLLLIARTAGTSAEVGYFTKPGGGIGLHPVDCGGKKASALTQNDASNRQDVTVTWNPPGQGQGQVEFVATIHRDKNVWWKDTKSVVLDYTGSGKDMTEDDVMTGGGGAEQIKGLGLIGLLWMCFLAVYFQ